MLHALFCHCLLRMVAHEAAGGPASTLDRTCHPMATLRGMAFGNARLEALDNVSHRRKTVSNRKDIFLPASRRIGLGGGRSAVRTSLVSSVRGQVLSGSEVAAGRCSLSPVVAGRRYVGDLTLCHAVDGCPHCSLG